jgi:lysozyme
MYRSVLLLALAAFALACSPEGIGSSGAAVMTVCGASSAGPVQGIDVSVYQGSFDWSAQKAAGVVWGYARIGDGLGGDSEFASNWSKMEEAGVLRGAYQFFEPEDDETAQATLMVEAVGMLGAGDLPCMIDVEVTGGQSGEAIASKVATWMSVVQSGTGRAPIVYTGPYFWEENVDAIFDGVPLWVADYGPSCPLLPSGWFHWTMWQYGNGGGLLDHDVFNGTLADLQALAGMTPQSNPPNVAAEPYFASHAHRRGGLPDADASPEGTAPATSACSVALAGPINEARSLMWLVAFAASILLVRTRGRRHPPR